MNAFASASWGTTPHNAASLDDSRMAAWIPHGGSADSDLIDDNHIITPRARDLVRNNPMASGAVQTNKDNVIGSQLRLSAQPKYRLLGWDKDQATTWSNQVEDQFSTWADSTECDASRSQTFLGLTNQALAGMLVNGDALAIVMWLPRADGKWSTRLQTVESDRLATPPWLAHDRTVHGGVKLDNETGAALGYWIQKNHPGDDLPFNVARQDNWEYINAFTPWGRRQVIHLYDKERSGQSRGKSIFSAVMREFRMAGEYMGHELHAAVANAVNAILLESNLDAEAVAQLFTTQNQEGESYYQSQIGKKWNDKKVEGGKYVTLPAGTTVANDPLSRPNTAFDGFMESIMRHMATGLNMPYELLLKDFSKTNYSSARSALLEAWRYFNSLRRIMQDHWLNPAYEAWMEEAVNTQRVTAPDYYQNRFAYHHCRWVFAGRGWVDPVKEAKGVELRLKLNITTMEHEAAEQGKDYLEVMDQRLRELAEALNRTRAQGLPDKVAYALTGFGDADLGDVDEFMHDAEDKDNADSNSDNQEELVDDGIKRDMDAYGVGVRAGSITAQPDDEKYFRNKSGLPEMSEEVLDAWEEDGGVRRPITLQSGDAFNAEQDKLSGENEKELDNA